MNCPTNPRQPENLPDRVYDYGPVGSLIAGNPRLCKHVPHFPGSRHTEGLDAETNARCPDMQRQSQVLQVEGDEAPSGALVIEEQVTSLICGDLATAQLAVVWPVQDKAGAKARLQPVGIGVQRKRGPPAQVHHFAGYQRCPPGAQVEQSRTTATG